MDNGTAVTTPLDILGPDYTVSFWINRRENAKDGEQILFEANSTPYGKEGSEEMCHTYQFKAVQKETGKVGFSRENYDYSFDYKLPEGEWVELSFCSGENKNVSLRVKDADGETVYTDPKFYYKNHPETEMSAKRGNSRVNTLLIPFGRIGSETDSFQGKVDEIVITGTNPMPAAPGAIPHSEMTVSACSQSQTSADGREGPAENAIDEREDTYWHTDWSSDTSLSEENPHYFEVTLASPHIIDRLTYLPRQDSTNGMIYRYSIEVTRPDGTVQLVADKAEWGQGNGFF